MDWKKLALVVATRVNDHPLSTPLLILDHLKKEAPDEYVGLVQDEEYKQTAYTFISQITTKYRNFLFEHKDNPDDCLMALTSRERAEEFAENF